MVNITTSPKQNLYKNQTTQTLEQLEKRIPLVSDKALIDLVNGIQINQDIISYRKNRGFFARSIPQQRFNNTPILFSLGTTLELAQLPPEVKPKKPGKSATEICRQQINNIPRQMDIKEFITAIVQEIANDSLFQLITRQDNLYS